MGAVVSEYFVLTAAHCFMVEDEKHSIKVNVGKDAVGSHLQAHPILSTNLPLHPKVGENGTQIIWGKSWEAAYINDTHFPPLRREEAGPGDRRGSISP